MAWSQAYDMGIIGLRYFNVVGTRQDPAGPYAAVIPRWISALRAGQRPVIYGDGLTSRDFCPVANVVQANLLAANTEHGLAQQVFNVALGGRTTLLELFTTLRDELAALGAPCAALEPIHEGFRPGDIRHSLADIGAISGLLGYSPRVDLREGLRAAVHGSPERP
jgi:UDP-N-acetylglucosamine 4-epimerase